MKKLLLYILVLLQISLLNASQEVPGRSSVIQHLINVGATKSDKPDEAPLRRPIFKFIHKGKELPNVTPEDKEKIMQVMEQDGEQYDIETREPDDKGNLVPTGLMRFTTTKFEPSDNKPKSEEAVEPTSGLMGAVIDGDEAKVKEELEKKADINKKDDKGYSALHYAILFNKPELAKLLINNKNIDINITDNDGFTPLALAAQEGQEAIVALLLANKADINFRSLKNKKEHLANLEKLTRNFSAEDKKKVEHANKNKMGLTPLMVAAQAGHDGIISLLMSAGADSLAEGVLPGEKEPMIKVNAKTLADKKGRKLPNFDKIFNDAWQNGFRLMLMLIGKDIAKAKEILNNNKYVHVNYPHDFMNATQGKSLVHLATELGDMELIKMMIARGADVNIPVKEGYVHHGATPLYDATLKNNKELIKLLIDAGANPNIKYLGVTPPLWLAVYGNNVELAKLLLAAGAQVDHGILLQAKMKSDNDEMISLLLEKVFGRSFAHFVKSK